MESKSFIKLHGCGNDFVVLEDFQSAYSSDFWQKQSKFICDRHFGVGSDGLMVLRRHASADFEILMCNPDGSLMGMCGNGVRCVCRFLALEQLVPNKDKHQVHFLIEGREISCTLFEDAQRVRVDMGAPSFQPEIIPVLSSHECVQEPIEVETKQGKLTFRFTAVSMGNPHCVIFLQPDQQISLNELGPLFEHHPKFPRRANVEFVRIKAPDCISVRVWERGAGITLACGTGACAAVVAFLIQEKEARTVRVELPGGEVHVEWNGSHGDSVFLIGPAKDVFRGSLVLGGV